MLNSNFITSNFRYKNKFYLQLYIYVSLKLPPNMVGSRARHNASSDVDHAESWERRREADSSLKEHMALY